MGHSNWALVYGLQLDQKGTNKTLALLGFGFWLFYQLLAKILVLNFVPTRPELENSQKNSKKIQKIKKHHSSIISIQTGLRLAEKEIKKNSVTNFVPTRPGQEN